MKKNKLLVPILAVAGLGTTIAPLVMMTSCGDKGTKLDKATFQTKIENIMSEFNNDADAKAFDAEDITFKAYDRIKKTIEEKTVRFVQNQYNDEQNYRKVEVVLDESNTEEITFNAAYSELQEMLAMEGKEGFTISYSLMEYKDSLKSNINYSKENAGSGTCEVVFYKNGFLKSYNRVSKKMSGEETKMQFYLEYKKAPHEITTFKIAQTNDYNPNVYLKVDGTYVVKFTTTTGGITKFCVDVESEALPITITEGEGIQGWTYNPTTNVYSGLALEAQTEYTIKFKFDGKSGKNAFTWLNFDS